MTDDPRDATIRRLCVSSCGGPRRTSPQLEQQQSYAQQTILDLRRKLGTRVNQAAEPR